MNAPRPVPHRPDPGEAPAGTPRPVRRWRAAPQQRSSRLPNWLDPASWTGALVLMSMLAAVLWIVQLVNSQYRLTQYGLRPRHLIGLRGVLTEPFLHADWEHLYSNTIPLILIGWVLLLSGLRTWLIVTAIVVVGGGLLTWLVAPSNDLIVGASGMIFGWLGYLVARAVFSRELKWILVAVLVGFFFSTLLYGLLPTLHSTISWQARACGFAFGVVAAALLHHPRGGPGVLGRATRR